MALFALMCLTVYTHERFIDLVPGRCRLQFVERDGFGKSQIGAGLSTRRSILAVSSDALIRDDEVQYLRAAPNGQDTVFLHLVNTKYSPASLRYI